MKTPHRYANTYRAEHSRSRTQHKYIIPRLSGERKGENMDKMKQYVERFFSTTKKNSKYGMSFSEMEHGMKEVFSATDANRAFKVITTLFDFGYAKGYRAAMAEIKKGGARA